MKLKKDDTVKIIAGKDKGKIGKIVKIDPVNEKVIVSGLNMVSKTIRRKNQADKGGIMQVEAPIHVSNEDWIQVRERKEGPLRQEDRRGALVWQKSLFPTSRSSTTRP